MGSSQAGAGLSLVASAWPLGSWSQRNATRSLLTGSQCWGLACTMYKIIECPPPGRVPCVAGPQGNIGYNNSGFNSIGVSIVGNKNAGCNLQGARAVLHVGKGGGGGVQPPFAHNHSPLAVLPVNQVLETLGAIWWAKGRWAI